MQQATKNAPFDQRGSEDDDRGPFFATNKKQKQKKLVAMAVASLAFKSVRSAPQPVRYISGDPSRSKQSEGAPSPVLAHVLGRLRRGWELKACMQKRTTKFWALF